MTWNRPIAFNFPQSLKIKSFSSSTSRGFDPVERSLVGSEVSQRPFWISSHTQSTWSINKFRVLFVNSVTFRLSISLLSHTFFWFPLIFTRFGFCFSIVSSSLTRLQFVTCSTYLVVTFLTVFWINLQCICNYPTVNRRDCWQVVKHLHRRNEKLLCLTRSLVKKNLAIM